LADGMNFLFSIDSKTPGLEDLLSKLDKTNVFMERGQRGLKGIDDGMKHAGEGAKGLAGAFERLVTSGLEPFLEKAKGIAEFEFIREGAEKLLEFPGELADKIKELSVDVVMTAANTERMGHAFENALGKDVGKETLEYFDALADKTEFTHEQIRGMGLELSRSGFKGEGLYNAIAAVTDLGSMSGPTLEQAMAGAESATSALQRIMTTGRIEAKSLLPFGIHEDQFKGELAKETGLGMEAAAKAMEAGKIPIETVLDSLYVTIQDKTGKMLGGAGTDMSHLLGARIAHLKEQPELMFERFANTTSFTKLSDSLGHILDKLDPTKEPGAHIFKGIETFFERLPILINLTTHALEGLSGGLAVAAGPLAPLIAIGAGSKMMTHSEQEHAKDLAKHAVFGHDQAELDKMGFFERLGIGFSGAARTVAGMVTGHHFGHPDPPKGLDALHDVAPKAPESFHDIGGNNVKGFVGGIEDATPDGIHAMIKFGNDTTGALMEAHEQHSPSELFNRIARLDVEGYALGTEEGARRVAEAMDATYEAPEQARAIATGGGGVVLHIDANAINVTVEGGGDGQEQGRLILRVLEDEFDGMLARTLERISRSRGC
jgi:hypothetical protein